MEENYECFNMENSDDIYNDIEAAEDIYEYIDAWYIYI